MFAQKMRKVSWFTEHHIGDVKKGDHKNVYKDDQKLKVIGNNIFQVP